MGTLTARIDDTRTNLQTRSAEFYAQTRDAGASLLSLAREEANGWREYLLARRFLLQRELRSLSTPSAFERRALELTAEGLAAAKSAIDTRLVELAAMEAAKKRVQAKKKRPAKRVATATKSAAPAGKSRPAAKKKTLAPVARSRSSKRIEFPAPN